MSWFETVYPVQCWSWCERKVGSGSWAQLRRNLPILSWMSHFILSVLSATLSSNCASKSCISISPMQCCTLLCLTSGACSTRVLSWIKYIIFFIVTGMLYWVTLLKKEKSNKPCWTWLSKVAEILQEARLVNHTVWFPTKLQFPSELEKPAFLSLFSFFIPFLSSFMDRITEQSNWKIELGHYLVEGQPAGKWGMLAHPAPNLSCNWEIIWGSQLEFFNSRCQQHAKLFHSNNNWRNLVGEDYHIGINWKTNTGLNVKFKNSIISLS